MATYISNQTGNWSSASTWLTAAAGFIPTGSAGAPPQSFGFDKIVIRGGHIVTYDTSGVFGDQTSTFGQGTGATSTGLNTIASNAIILSGGTLKASRTVNTELTACGTIVIAPSGTLDWGTTTDPLTTNSNITLHYMQNLTGLSALSASSNSAGIYLYTGAANISYNHHFYICGKSKLRNTTLATSAVNGATVISVVSATGWEIGDKLTIATESISTIQTGGVLSATNIVSLTGNNITISTPLNTSRSAGTCVGNFTSNVNVKSYSGQYPSFGIYLVPSVDSIISINNCRLADMGNSATSTAPYYAVGWVPYNYTGATSRTSSNGNPTSPISLNFAFNTIPATLKGICIDYTHTSQTLSPGSVSLNLFGSFPDYNTLEDIAIHQPTQISNGISILVNGQVTASLKNCTIYRAVQGISFGSSFPNNITFDNVNIDATFVNAPQNYGLQWTMTNCKLRSLNSMFVLDGVQNATISNSIIQNGVSTGMFSPNLNSVGTINIVNCTITPSTSAALNIASGSVNNRMGQNSQFNIYQLNEDVFNNRRFNYFHYSVSDLTVRKNGITTLKIKPNRANTALYLYNTVNGIVGVPQRIKGSLRFDSNYGTSNPPSISFVGAGVNTTFTCTPTTNVWQDFDLTLNPTSTGDILMTITCQSSGTNGFVWLDGIPFTPFITDVRWYGFEVDKNFYRTVDINTTLTENQVSAYPYINNLDFLYDECRYWTVTNPTSSSYIDLVNSLGKSLDFSNKGVLLNSAALSSISYNSNTNLITLSTFSLSAGNNFNTIETTGGITINDNSAISNVSFIGSVSGTTARDLNSVIIDGTLTYNTNATTVITYTNCNIKKVENNGSGIITLNRSNTVVTEAGRNIVLLDNPTYINITNLDGGYIAIFDNNDIIRYYTNQDQTIILPNGSTGTWSYKIGKYNYKTISGTFSVGNTININPIYIRDIYVYEEFVNVASSYNIFKNVQEIYDYFSYFSTTSSGLSFSNLYSYRNALDLLDNALIIDVNASPVFSYDNNIVKIKSSNLESGAIIKTIETTNNIYLSGNSSLSALKVISPFSYYESVQDLNNLNVEGTIVYDIDTPISIIYTNCTVSRVINTGDGMVTITRINSTITDESDAEVETVVPISININVDSSTYVAIYKPDGTRYRYGSGNTTIILGGDAVTGEWSYKVAKYGYEFYSGIFLIDTNVSSVTNIEPTLSIDSSVTITDVNTIIAYTDLNTTRKIYDYLSYYKTTSDGIIYGTFASRTIGSIILTKELILDSTASSIVSIASDILTVKSSGLDEEITIYTSGDFTLLNNSVISENVKIRANNIDSELLVIGIEELVLYPSINARDTNTSRGPVITGNIFRFKYGSTIDGVLMQGTLYVRADVGAILLNEFLINIGNNVVDLGTFGQIQRVLFNQNIINDGIKKSSRSIPHSTDL
jgi:hypothetical protein